MRLLKVHNVIWPKENRLRLSVVLLPGVISAAVLLLGYDHIPQPLSYHDFSDQRVVFGIPHAGDVLTNLAFLLVGGWGLWLLVKPGVIQTAFIDSRELRSFRWLFGAVFLTALGSGWYHLEPDNYRLTWDRLPMAVAFMSVFSVMIAERVSSSVGTALLAPLIAFGMASVLWWIWTEHTGEGDLRWYLLVQFYPLISMALMLFLLPSPYTHGNHYWGLFAFYLAAKAAESLDHEIFDLTMGLISGHNLKHLFAAAGAAWVLRMLYLRRVRSN